jgi:hypothetical protein
MNNTSSTLNQSLNQTHLPETKKPFVIYSKPLAGYLLSNYCELLRVVPGIKNPTKNVYMFENTSKLQQHIEDFKLLQSSKPNNN